MGEPIYQGTKREDLGWVRRAALAPVVIGALLVSISGQVAGAEPKLHGWAWVLAGVNDVGALVALNEVLSTRRWSVRISGWAAIVLAGGTAAGLNTWHTTAEEGAPLPHFWAAVIGWEPVVLAAVLSHLVALVLNPPVVDVQVAVGDRARELSAQASQDGVGTAVAARQTARPVPAENAPVEPTPLPAMNSGNPLSAPAGLHVVPTARARTRAELVDEYLAANPGAGRRSLARHLTDNGHPISESAARSLLPATAS